MEEKSPGCRSVFKKLAEKSADWVSGVGCRVWG
jgi:hypothetical protein